MAFKKRILIVDDDPDVCSCISEILSAAGFETAQAGDGGEALEILRSLKPDLIIADVVLPRMDGWKLCQAVKAYHKTKFIPIIMLTGKSDGTLEMMTHENHADACLTKPFSNERLVEIVERITHKSL